MDGSFQCRPVLCAEALRDNDLCPCRKPVEKSNDTKDELARGTDSGKGIPSQEAADDEAVHRVVQLLEDVPSKQGQGEADNLREDRSLSHIRAEPFRRFRHIPQKEHIKKVPEVGQHTPSSSGTSSFLVSPS